MAWTTSADRMRSVAFFTGLCREARNAGDYSRPAVTTPLARMRSAAAVAGQPVASRAVRLAVLAGALAAIVGAGFDTNLAIAACGGLIAGFGLTRTSSAGKPNTVAAQPITQVGNPRRDLTTVSERSPLPQIPPPLPRSQQGEARDDLKSDGLTPVTVGAPKSIADLTAQMSHDLRTPLNAVIGFSDLMKQEVYGPIGNDRYREYASHIEQSGQALLAATEDALAVTTLMARPSHRAGTTVDLLDVLDALDLETIADGQHDCRDHRHSANIAIRGETAVLRQAITRCAAIVRARSQSTAHIRAEVQPRGESVTLILSTATASCDPTNESATIEQKRPDYPRPHDDLGYCLAHALCELQGIDLKLLENKKSCTIRMTMERAEAQACLFETA